MLLNLPREGLHLGVVASWLKSTALNPALTSLILSAGLGILRQDHLDSTLAASLMTAVWLLIYLTIFGAVITLNDKLTVGSLNNWVKDTDWDWASEIVVVTGGSSGIGASIVQEFLKRHINAKIVIIDYNKPSASISSDERVKFYQADLSDSLAIKQLAANIKADVGNPTVLVNNAGLTRGKSIMDGSYGDVNMTFSTNIIAPFLLTKEFLPGMVAQNHGHIFAIASMSAIISPAGLADYAATKAGLLAMQEALRQELRFMHQARKVRVSSAVLSFVKTPMFKGETNQSHFFSPLIHVDTVGSAIVDVLDSGESRIIWLPGIAAYLASLRGGPEWLMEIVRNGTQKLKVDFVGRQNIDKATGRLID